MTAADVAEYLENNLVGTRGTDLFVNKLPQTADLPASDPVAVVFDTGGIDPQLNADRKHRQPTVQVLVTGAPSGNDAASAMMESIFDVLSDPMTTVVGSTTYYGIYPQGDVSFLGYDANNRPEFSANFRLFKREDR